MIGQGLRAFIVATCMGVGVLAQAQGYVTIGSGAQELGPTGSSPYNIKNSGRRVQFIIPASDLIMAGGAAGNIQRLAWNVVAAGTGTVNGYTIRMGHTTQPFFPTGNSFLTSSPAFTTVYNNTNYQPAGTGFQDINFTTNFNWNGTGNILVEVCWTINAGSNSAGNIRGDARYRAMASSNTATSSQCSAIATGTVNLRPQVRFYMATTTPPSNGCLSVANESSNPQYPTPTFTPTCTGTPETIGTVATTRDYSLVQLTSGTTYTFSSSVVTDRITIGNAGGTAVWASGTGPLVFTPSSSGAYRFYTHLNASCGSDASFRARRVQCGVAVPVPSCATTPVPAHQSTACLSTTTLLSWNTVADATGYDIYFNAGASATTLVSINQTGTTFNAATPSAGSYAWRIVPRNSTGSATGCATWTFTRTAPTLWYADADGDGFGDPTQVQSACVQPVGSVANASDCNDGDANLTMPGQTCDDGDPATENDVVTSDCACVGTVSCSEYPEIDFNIPSDDIVSWQLVSEDGGTVVQSGTAQYTTTVQTCVPAGEYRLVVSGMPTDGSYVLRSGPAYVPPVPPIYEPAPFPGDRVIENVSPVSGSHQVATYGNSGAPVQLPQGEARLLYLNCDKTWWKPTEYIVANEVPAVAAEWVLNGTNAQQDATTGYDFWFYEPNGGYSYVRQRRHNQADNYGNVGSSRTCHARLSWAATAGPALPVGVMLNVRVRAVVNGVAGNWGPACRFMLNPDAANCIPTSLIRQPGHTNYSCGVVRKNITHTNQRIFAQPVSGANRYEFTFQVDPSEPVIRRYATTYYINLGWTGPQALQNNTEYTVWVRASKDGGATWCEEEMAGYGCKVYICNNPPYCGGSGFTGGGEGVNGGGTGLLVARDAQLRLWPNPNRGDQLWLNLTGMDTEVLTVSVDIHDLSGKRVVARELALQQGPMALELNHDLAAGTYLVTIIASEQRFMERLVIQR